MPLPQTTRFLAIYLLAQRESGLSELPLSQDLGVADNAAWKPKHKVLQVLHDHNQAEKLSGRENRVVVPSINSPLSLWCKPMARATQCGFSIAV